MQQIKGMMRAVFLCAILNDMKALKNIMTKIPRSAALGGLHGIENVREPEHLVLRLPLLNVFPDRTCAG